MNEAVIVSAARTAVGKAPLGALRGDRFQNAADMPWHLVRGHDDRQVGPLHRKIRR